MGEMKEVEMGGGGAAPEVASGARVDESRADEAWMDEAEEIAALEAARDEEMKGRAVQNLAEGFATMEEIGTAVGLTPDELWRLYGAWFRRGRAVGAMKVRQAQVEQALKGNGPLLIWLGKQYLGQRDGRGDGAGASRKGGSLDIERTGRVGIGLGDARERGAGDRETEEWDAEEWDAEERDAGERDAGERDAGELVRLYRAALGAAR